MEDTTETPNEKSSVKAWALSVGGGGEALEWQVSESRGEGGKGMHFPLHSGSAALVLCVQTQNSYVTVSPYKNQARPHNMMN